MIWTYKESNQPILRILLKNNQNRSLERTECEQENHYPYLLSFLKKKMGRKFVWRCELWIGVSLGCWWFCIIFLFLFSFCFWKFISTSILSCYFVNTWFWSRISCQLLTNWSNSCDFFIFLRQEFLLYVLIKEQYFR